jgi:NIPSNAP
MLKNTWFVLGASTAIFVAGFSLGSLRQAGSVAHAQAGKHVYELRTYTAPEGKLGELNARFRNHTISIFNKHGMKSVLYMTPQDAPDSQNTLIYVLEHPSREAAKKAWADFSADPEWKKVSEESQVNGRLTSKVVSVFGDPTDYSPMK